MIDPKATTWLISGGKGIEGNYSGTPGIYDIASQSCYQFISVLVNAVVAMIEKRRLVLSCNRGWEERTVSDIVKITKRL